MPLPTTDLHHDFDSRFGKSQSGSALTAWVDQVAGYTLTTLTGANDPEVVTNNPLNGIDPVYFAGNDNVTRIAEWGPDPADEINQDTYPYKYVFAVLQVPHGQATDRPKVIFDTGESFLGGRQSIVL